MTAMRKTAAQNGYFDAPRDAGVGRAGGAHAPAMTAEAMSKAIYQHKGFTREAALKAFGHIERRTK